MFHSQIWCFFHLGVLFTLFFQVLSTWVCLVTHLFGIFFKTFSLTNLICLLFEFAFSITYLTHFLFGFLCCSLIWHILHWGLVFYSLIWCVSTLEAFSLTYLRHFPFGLVFNLLICIFSHELVFQPLIWFVFNLS